MHKIVFASGNKGKVAELSALFAELAVTLEPQSQYGVEPAEETGRTFVENAILKARHASRETGLPAIADDSGLEVDALDGAPGVYSARFAGADADDAANNRLLLERLAGVPAAERSARFHCLLVYMRHAEDPTPLICHGSWEGRILEAPRGEGGFGYDPLFFVPSENASAAELPAAEKNRLSHRGQAVRALVAALGAKLGA